MKTYQFTCDLPTLEAINDAIADAIDGMKDDGDPTYIDTIDALENLVFEDIAERDRDGPY